MIPKITMVCLLLLIAVQEQPKNKFPPLTGPYFGQTAPREKAEVFMDGVISTEDEPAPGSPQSLVGGAGGNLTGHYRIAVKPGDDQPADMCDIRHDDGIHVRTDLTETVKINMSGIGAGTGDNHFRPVFPGQT